MQEIDKRSINGLSGFNLKQRGCVKEKRKQPDWIISLSLAKTIKPETYYMKSSLSCFKFNKNV